MKDFCKGCGLSKSIVEYINNKEVVGSYCVDCMTCNECGDVLPVDRLAFMQVVSIKGDSAYMSIPARTCAKCIANPIPFARRDDDVTYKYTW